MSAHTDPTDSTVTEWEETDQEQGWSRAADAQQRADTIGDLRALADFLQAHPEVPIARFGTVEVVYFPGGHDSAAEQEVARVADLLGVRSVREGEHLVAEHRVGRCGYRAVAIPEQARQRHRALMSYADRVHPA